MIETIRALGVLAEAPDEGTRAIAAALDLPLATTAEHTELFGFQLFPYLSVHVGPDGKLGGEARDRVDGFVRALGGTPAPNDSDHLAVLLGAYAELLGREREAAGAPRAGWRRAREALLVEHLLPWVPGLLARVLDLGGPAHRAWADRLDAVLEREAADVGAGLGLLSSHLTDVPTVADPRTEGVDALIESLLAPARAGVVLTSADLVSAARVAGLGHRIGERRFVLRSLFEQDAAAVLSWLTDFTMGEAERWQRHWLAGTATGEWWRRRASTTADLLHVLCRDAALAAAR